MANRAAEPRRYRSLKGKPGTRMPQRNGVILSFRIGPEGQVGGVLQIPASVPDTSFAAANRGMTLPAPIAVTAT